MSFSQPRLSKISLRPGLPQFTYWMRLTQMQVWFQNTALLLSKVWFEVHRCLWLCRLQQWARGRSIRGSLRRERAGGIWLWLFGWIWPRERLLATFQEIELISAFKMFFDTGKKSLSNTLTITYVFNKCSCINLVWKLTLKIKLPF